MGAVIHGSTMYIVHTVQWIQLTPKLHAAGIAAVFCLTGNTFVSVTNSRDS